MLLSSINIPGDPARSVPSAVLIWSTRTAQLSLLIQLKPCIPELVGVWRF